MGWFSEPGKWQEDHVLMWEHQWAWGNKGAGAGQRQLTVEAVATGMQVDQRGAVLSKGEACYVKGQD